MIQKEVRFAGKTFNFSLRNEGDFAIAGELFLERQYRMCEEIIKKAKSGIIDIGGHLGFFSLMASALNPTVPIYSFEPHIGNFEILKQNLRENGVRNVVARQVAASNSVGETFLQLSQEDLNHSLVLAIEPTGKTQKVQTTTLERIFEKNRIEKCDLLKLDCEGSEYDILESTPRPLFAKISAIFLEYHDWGQVDFGARSKKLQTYLQTLGYKVTRFPNSKMKELGYLWCEK